MATRDGLASGRRSCCFYSRSSKAHSVLIMEKRLELLPRLLMTTVAACLRDLRQGGVSQPADAGKLTPGAQRRDGFQGHYSRARWTAHSSFCSRSMATTN